MSHMKVPQALLALLSLLPLRSAIAQVPAPTSLPDLQSAGELGADLFVQSGTTGMVLVPPSMVGDAYAELLQMNDPVQNVVVGSPHEPFATQGGNTLVEQELIAENQISAVPFKPGK